jgi:hypothetical protein
MYEFNGILFRGSTRICDAIMVNIWHGWRHEDQYGCGISKMIYVRGLDGLILGTTLVCYYLTSTSIVAWETLKLSITRFLPEPSGFVALLAYWEGFWILVEGAVRDMWWRGFICKDKLESMENGAGNKP